MGRDWWSNTAKTKSPKLVLPSETTPGATETEEITIPGEGGTARAAAEVAAGDTDTIGGAHPAIPRSTPTSLTPLHSNNLGRASFERKRSKGKSRRAIDSPSRSRSRGKRSSYKQSQRQVSPGAEGRRRRADDQGRKGEREKQWEN